MPDVTDLQKVAQYVKSDRAAPPDTYNAACRVLDGADEVERLRAERDRLQITNRALNAAAIEALERAEKAEAELTLLRHCGALSHAVERAEQAEAAIERVEADAREQQKQTGVTHDLWKLGVYAQASRTLCILRDAPNAPVLPSGGARDGLTGAGGTTETGEALHGAHGAAQ